MSEDVVVVTGTQTNPDFDVDGWLFDLMLFRLAQKEIGPDGISGNSSDLWDFPPVPSNPIAYAIDEDTGESTDVNLENEFTDFPDDDGEIIEQNELILQEQLFNIFGLSFEIEYNADLGVFEAVEPENFF